MTTKLTPGQAWCVPLAVLAGLTVGGLNGQRAPADAPGSALTAGTTLTYSSGGREQAPWTVDSIHRGISHGGRDGCTRIFLRMRPDQASATPRVACRGGDTLFAWNATASEWRAERPLGGGMTLRVPQPSGATLNYTTAQVGDTTVSGHRFAFVRTTIVTSDPEGRAIRRLSERYAVALATALGGVFEVPDSAAAGAWRESQRFDLVRVAIP